MMIPSPPSALDRLALQSGDGAVPLDAGLHVEHEWIARVLGEHQFFQRVFQPDGAPGFPGQHGRNCLVTGFAQRIGTLAAEAATHVTRNHTHVLTRDAERGREHVLCGEHALL